ncbi:AsmA-like C-terminal region-containing protein [Chitinophaga arvensicola]|uniref:AsmA-like C-terminal region n=1 Tax=Chitinophaga arvensicola TaxID=29529 RepID=A0A1I0S5I0_9BACT|nr:AsmA-like C-terminal region-containing protein [Chitinophaga arvensicola]SEW50104.1 AsmA-like C-terminal region [Chitinophaga arvensicola]
MKRGKKIIRLLLIVIGIFLLVMGVAGGILYSQQERLTQMAVKELNKQFAGELVITKSSISPFSNFPYISIALHDVRFFADKRMKGAPLYQVERLYVGFSLPDILQQHYNARIIVLANGRVHVARYANGDVDLIKAHEFKSTGPSAPADSTEAMMLDLKKIILKNIDVTYLDGVSGIHVNTHIDKIKTAFSMDSARIAIDMDSKLEIDITGKTDTSLFRHKQLQFKLAAVYDKQKKQLTLPPGTIRLEEASLQLQGIASERYVDLKVKGDKPDMNLLLAMVPADVAAMLEKYRHDGRIFFDGIVKGAIGKGVMPLMEFNFGCENVWFQNKKIDRKVDSLGFKGFYTNGAAHNLQTSELHILNFNAKPGTGVFKGNFVMKNFTDPQIIMQLYSELNLRFVGEFLGIKDLEQISGEIKLNMNFRELVDMRIPEESLAKLKEGVQSELTVKNLEFRIPGYHLPVRNMNVHAMIQQGRLQLDSIAFRIGSSDILAQGAISDVPALFHAQDKPVAVNFSASSKRLQLGELYKFDSTHPILSKEVITGFNIGLAFETSVKELLHPNPLPKGTFKVEKLYAKFQQYPHALHDFNAAVIINDTSLRVPNFSGNIDSSGFAFKGRLNNYLIWFDKIKKGNTEVAFDFKSSRLAVNDLVSERGHKFIPQGYWYEEANNVWLRTKMNIKYDTVFKKIDAKIANISGTLKQHPINIENITGRIRYGNNRFIVIDTLTGKVGRTDFDLNMRYAVGQRKNKEKKTNYFRFKSNMLDIDELMNYDFSEHPVATAAPVRRTTVRENDSLHAAGFNVFNIPFSEFEAQVDVKKVKYKKLWLKNLLANVHMREDRKIKVDTIAMNVAGGHVAMRGMFNAADPQKLYFKNGIYVKNVDLSKLLIKFDNFGQDFMLNNNLQGTLSGHIKSNIRMHPDLTPVLSETESQMDIEISNGTLLDFGPMQAMAGYFKDKNLRMVRFDTLRNKLSLKNGMLEIPNMNINSSLGYIEVSGNQSLDMSMNYYLRIPMKMVTQVGFRALFGKKQEEVDIDQVDAIEYRDKDKKVRFMNLNISGTPDKYKIALKKAKKTT